MNKKEFLRAVRLKQEERRLKEIREQEVLREALTASSTKPLPEPKPSRVTSTYSYRNLEEAMVEQRRLIMESAPKITPFQGYEQLISPLKDPLPPWKSLVGVKSEAVSSLLPLLEKHIQNAMLRHLPQEEWEKLDKVWTLVQEFDVEAKEGFLKELESQIEERLKSEWR
jgi:CHAD domain-containing protein